ncbi:hypothetical protein ACVV2G_33090 [Streptomyces ziwulingensis]
MSAAWGVVVLLGTWTLTDANAGQSASSGAGAAAMWLTAIFCWRAMKAGTRARRRKN